MCLRKGREVRTVGGKLRVKKVTEILHGGNGQNVSVKANFKKNYRLVQ
jgi:hypothetical protein